MGTLVCVHNSFMYVFIGIWYVYIGLLRVIIYQMYTVVCAGALHFLLYRGMHALHHWGQLVHLQHCMIFFTGLRITLIYLTIGTQNVPMDSFLLSTFV